MTRARLAAALLLIDIALFAYAVAVQLDRPPNYDEAEFLHAAVRIARGDRIYIDFAEHHPPFAFVILSKLVGPSPAVRTALVQGRVLFGFFGAIAAAAVAWLVWRATRRAEAVAIALALLMSGPEVWVRAFADIRGEPLALAFWFAGAALVLVPASAAWQGVGIGLVGWASLINPKWPLETAIIAAVFVIRLARERGWFAIVTAVITMAAAVGAIVLMTPLDRFLYHVFEFNVVMRHWVIDVRHTAPAISVFFQCSPALHPIFVLPAAGVVGWFALRKDSPLDRRIALTAVALTLASLIEIRFLYSYPRIWQQYYIVWSIAGAMVLAMLPQVAEHALASSTPLARSIPLLLGLAALIMATVVIPLRQPSDPFWLHDAKLRAKLRPSDTEWVDFTAKPIGARDANYYWFGFIDFVPASLQAAKTPRGARFLPPITEEDLPPCRLERGLEPHLRLLADPLGEMPAARRCLRRLFARGVLAPTGLRGVWEVTAAKAK